MDRREIICNYDKEEFQYFLCNDSTGKVLELFNDEGIELLRGYQYNKERIEYILEFSEYRNQLFQNEKFVSVLFDIGIESWYPFRKLDYDTSLYIMNQAVALNNSVFAVFRSLSAEVKLKFLDHWNYSQDLLYYTLSYDEPIVQQKIIDHYNVDLSRVDLSSFFRHCKESTLMSRYQSNRGKIEMNIPSSLITQDVAKKIWESDNIFHVRGIINDASYVTDVSYLNDYVKRQEEKIILNSSNQEFLSPFDRIYEIFEKMNYYKSVEDIDHYYDLNDEYRELVRNIKIKNFPSKLDGIYRESGLEEVKNYLKMLSNQSLSNYIVDYHFEENYYNIILDINELLRFYFDGNISIPEDRVAIYQRISNIDQLSSEEKLVLFQELKKIPIMELFYDDLLKSRSIVAESIKESSITEESLSTYKDNELSNKYGIDVYTSDVGYFYGIVKSGAGRKGKMPEGHSFSLVSSSHIKVFAEDGITLLYDAGTFRPEQLVHVYPSDSFTLYHPFEFSTSATSRVNNLLTAPELASVSSYRYNELLILERGSEKTDIDSRIPRLKPIAVFCSNEIREEDLQYAREHGLGIFLARVKAMDDSVPVNDYRGEIDYWNYDYYDYTNYEDERFEKNRNERK